MLAEGRRLKLSNWDKVLSPKLDSRRAILMSHHARVASVLLPHLRDRPLTLKRYPNGVQAQYFYEKLLLSHRRFLPPRHDLSAPTLCAVRHRGAHSPGAYPGGDRSPDGAVGHSGRSQPGHGSGQSDQLVSLPHPGQRRQVHHQLRHRVPQREHHDHQDTARALPGRTVMPSGSYAPSAASAPTAS